MPTRTREQREQEPHRELNGGSTRPQRAHTAPEAHTTEHLPPPPQKNPQRTSVGSLRRYLKNRPAHNTMAMEDAAWMNTLAWATLGHTTHRPNCRKKPSRHTEQVALPYPTAHKDRLPFTPGRHASVREHW
jgi:hypothetical protein